MRYGWGEMRVGREEPGPADEVDRREDPGLFAGVKSGGDRRNTVA